VHSVAAPTADAGNGQVLLEQPECSSGGHEEASHQLGKPSMEHGACIHSLDEPW